METATRRKILLNGTDHSIAIGGTSLPHQIKNSSTLVHQHHHQNHHTRPVQVRPFNREVLQSTLSKLHHHREMLQSTLSKLHHHREVLQSTLSKLHNHHYYHYHHQQRQQLQAPRLASPCSVQPASVYYVRRATSHSSIASISNMAWKCISC